MHNVIDQGLLDVIGSDPLVSRIGSRVSAHTAFETLRIFGEEMSRKPLAGRQRKVLLASLWAFFEQFPTGILALTIRACDEWSRLDPWAATAMGANVLFADVDEYGLNNVAEGIYPTHHQMFLAFADHLGVSRGDLLAKENIVAGACELGDLVAQLYRHSSLASGLGMHFASELVASVEFVQLFNGFRGHKEAYGFTSDTDRALTFIRIHTTVEPKHLGQNCELIKSGLREGLLSEDEIVDAATVYLDQFDRVYAELNSVLFQR